MSLAVSDYLEIAKTEELAAQLRAAGYDVTLNAPASESAIRYDLLATRNGERIAFEVKARTQFGGSADQINYLRKLARHDGINEFRLVLVNPPHKTDVNIDGLDIKLLTYLADDMPSELSELASFVTLENISSIEIDNIAVNKEGISLTGTGTLDLTLNYDGGSERDGLTIHEGCPVSFDLMLDHALNIVEVKSLVVDTSAFYE